MKAYCSDGRDRDVKEKLINDWFENLDWIAKRFRFNGWGIEPQYEEASSYVRNIHWNDPEGEENADLCLFDYLGEIKYDQEFLERFAATEYITPYIVKGLFEQYKDDMEHWKLPGMEVFLDRLMREYSNVRRLKDLQCNVEPEYEFITEAGRSQDFWEMYFSEAYGNPYTILEEVSDVIERPFIQGNKKFLSDYIKCICIPSRDWRQAFLNSLHTTAVLSEDMEQPMYHSGKEVFQVKDKTIRKCY